MASTGGGPLPLSPYRCLDLSSEEHYLCGRILAHLGCDVIRIDDPGTGRRYPREQWLSFNRGKRSVTLDIGSARGGAILSSLAARSDFIITSRDSSLPAAAPDVEELLKANPHLIAVSISPYGDDGPRSSYASSELTAQAAGGLLFISGESGRPPVRLGIPIAGLMAAAQAGVAVLIALHARHRAESPTASGQYIDVSTQEAVVNLLMNAPLYWSLQGETLRRGGASLPSGGHRHSIWPCADGYVRWTWWVGPGWGRKNLPLFQWMAGDGIDPGLAEIDYEGMSVTTVSPLLVRRIEDAVRVFFARHRKHELYEEAIKRRIMLYPLNDTGDVLEDAQLQARDFWANVADPATGDVFRLPGPMFRSTEYELARDEHALEPGQHSMEVFGGVLGLSQVEVDQLHREGVV